MIDIGANLTDPVYKGVYHGSRKHPEDLTIVLDRARKNSVTHCIVTCGNLRDFDDAAFVLQDPSFLSRTLGFHPTRARELLADQSNRDRYHGLLSQPPSEFAKLNVRALGEIGLDYDRLNFASKDEQLQSFRLQLDLVAPLTVPPYNLPLFLHCRSAYEDFVSIMREFLQAHRARGVVHSFTGTLVEANAVLSLGLDIGINGCSLKTNDNIAVVARLPVARLHVETDCPWCDTRRTHASYKYLRKETMERAITAAVRPEKYASDASSCTFVKGRTEPFHLCCVIDVIAAVSEDPTLEGPDKRPAVCRVIEANSRRVFGLP